MTDYEALAKVVKEYRLAKVTLDAEGNVRCMIALPPEAQPVSPEDLDPQKERERIEKIMFAHVEG